MNIAPFPPLASAEHLGAEAQRQRELIEAVFSPQPADLACAGVSQRGAQWQAGLAAYRGNGLGHARNALRVQFPTLLAMLGDEAFDTLCSHYWRACPPRRGDLAWVGEELADFIETLPTLDAWPWLGDCARLDWALWQTAGAAPAGLNEADLSRLAAGDPQQLRLRLADGVRLVPSIWPVVTLYLAHHEADPDWAVVAQMLQCQQAQTALIWRQPVNALTGLPVQAIDAMTERWTTALGQGMSLDAALDAVGDAFDFAAWLDQAVRQGWLDAVLNIQPR